MYKGSEELRILALANEISDLIWDDVSTKDWFAKSTIGTQIVRSADSIGANIAESQGRISVKETLQFLYYSRGSIQELRFWLKKALKRGVVRTETFERTNVIVDNLFPQLNSFISKYKANKLPH